MRRFTADYVFTLEGPMVLKDAYVDVDEDGTILGTGLCGGSTDTGAEHFEGALVPGFVNAHCHVELSYMKGLFRKGTGMAGFIDQINALRDTLPREERIALIHKWLDRMYERGVSAMADISNCSDSFAVKASHPMYTRTFVEVFGDNPADVPSIISSARALCGEAASLGLDASVTPHASYTMSRDLLKAASEEALSSGFLSYHSQESSEEEEMISSGSGPMWENRLRNGLRTPPVGARSSLDYFAGTVLEGRRSPVGGNVLLVHEVCMDENDAKEIKEVFNSPFVALCPLSNIFIHNTLPPVGVMRRNRLDICVGTDSLSSNDDLDMLSEIRCLQDSFPDVPLEEIFSWACLGGARFLGKESLLGTFSKGKKPGVVHVGNLSPEGRLTHSSRSTRIV